MVWALHVRRAIVGLIAALESCARAIRTLPEESINGDSIEVVRQEGASEDHGCIEASVDARQERLQVGARSEAKGLDEGHFAIRLSAEIFREADWDALGTEAITGDAYQARCVDRAPAGSDCCEAGCSGRCRPRREREGPRRDLNGRSTMRDGTASPVPSLPSRYSRSLGAVRGTRQLS